MSPTAFKQQVIDLAVELDTCRQLCSTIRTTRRLGPTTSALDTLQDGLQSTSQKIQIEFNTLRGHFGSRMDLGDRESRQLLNNNIREVQLDLRSRLTDIASRRDDGARPGFGSMYRKLVAIEYDVRSIIAALSDRLELAAKPEPKKIEQPKKLKDDEVMIKMKDLNRYMDQMKSSWYETIVAGKLLYVNCWDEKKTQWERPKGAYVRGLPKDQKSRVQSWETRPLYGATDGYSVSGGW